MTQHNLIIVGVDGSKEGRQALEWACAEAQHHGSVVLAVSAWSVPPMPIAPPFGSFPWGGPPDLEDATRTMLAHEVDAVAPDFSGLEIRQEVLQGSAAEQLIRLSDQADLVVVGARGHGGFAGMLLGSVSQHVLAHSACTVAVVR